MAEDDGTTNRAVSTIRFPYGSLGDAIEVAETVHNQHGGSCTMDQLAASFNRHCHSQLPSAK